MRSWLKERTARVMSTTEAAWLAGFIDGEGSIICYLNGRGNRYKHWRIQVPNTHHGSIVHCKRITGCGTIVPKTVKGKRKPAWHWKVDAQRDVAAVLIQVMPYLVIKNRSAQMCIDNLCAPVAQRQEATDLGSVQ